MYCVLVDAKIRASNKDLPVTSNFKWKIFSNFVAFSEYPNFNVIGAREHISVMSNFKWKILQNFVAFSEQMNFNVVGAREHIAIK